MRRGAWPTRELTVHPYRSLAAELPDPRAEPDGPTLALGVLAAVSLVQLITAYHHAGLFAAQTAIGAGFSAAGLWGYSRAR